MRGNSHVIFPHTEDQKVSLALLIEHQDTSLAFLLSEVLGFHEFDALFEADDNISEQLKTFGIGSISYGNETYTVLDAEKLLRLVKAQLILA